MTSIQILKPFQTRTEYKVLKEWLPLSEKEVGCLDNGITLIPGSVLKKLAAGQMISLINWVKAWENQLILTPPWWSIDLGQLLGLSNQVQLNEEKGEFEGISCEFVLRSNIPSKWRNSQGKTVAVDLQHHLGSGTITITTVPLLDYRFLNDDQKNKGLLLQLLHLKEPATVNETNFQLTDHHILILLLAAANIDIGSQLEEKFKVHYGKDLSNPNALRDELLAQGFLNSKWQATARTQQQLLGKGYQTFIRELRKQGDMNEW